MESQPKKGRLLSFVSFLLAFLLVVGIIDGDFWQIANWSSAENIGGALFQIILLVGAIFFVKEVLLPALQKRKE